MLKDVSKIIDSLKKIQFRRENSSHPEDSAPSVASSNKANPEIRKPNTRANKNSDGNWFVPVIFALFMLVTFGLNLKLFLMMRDYRTERDQSIKKVNEVVELLEKRNKLQAEAFSIQMKIFSKENAQLKEELQAQKVAVENLTKAKNTLFKRISAIEAELGQIKQTGK